MIRKGFLFAFVQMFDFCKWMEAWFSQEPFSLSCLDCIAIFEFHVVLSLGSHEGHLPNVVEISLNF